MNIFKKIKKFFDDAEKERREIIVQRIADNLKKDEEFLKELKKIIF